MTKEARFPIMEIFGPTIQGEGLMSGTVTNFLRTGGCGLRCTWCDTMFAVDPKQVRAGRKMMTTDEIMKALNDMQFAPWLTITGGDPCLHKDLDPLILRLNVGGIQVAIETQGQLFPDWLEKADAVTFSPKPPSSGNIVDYDHMIENMREMWGLRHMGRRTRLCIKVVVFNNEDFQYAMDVYKTMPRQLYDSFYFTAGTEQYEDQPTATDAEAQASRALDRVFNVLQSQRELAKRMLDTSWVFDEKVHIGCQQHVLLWPEKEQGV